MTKKEIAKDFLFKVVIPVFLAWFLYAMFKNVFTNDGVTNYFYVWLVCGIPFGIRRMSLWLLPHSGSSLQFTIGIWALNFIAGGIIGGVILIWRLVVAVWYIVLTIYRIATYRNQIPAEIPVADGE
jgi:cell division protein FtsW (lipid II flippase)